MLIYKKSWSEVEIKRILLEDERIFVFFEKEKIRGKERLI